MKVRKKAGGLGVAEIAAKLRVELATVTKWRHRRVLPDPDHTTASADLWDDQTIERWARRTNRWPHDTT